jgi:hypothetical protein
MCHGGLVPRSISTRTTEIRFPESFTGLTGGFAKPGDSPDASRACGETVLRSWFRQSPAADGHSRPGRETGKPPAPSARSHSDAEKTADHLGYEGMVVGLAQAGHGDRADHAHAPDADREGAAVRREQPRLDLQRLVQRDAYSIGVRMPKAERRPLRLWKIDQPAARRAQVSGAPTR